MSLMVEQVLGPADGRMGHVNLPSRLLACLLGGWGMWTLGV